MVEPASAQGAKPLWADFPFLWGTPVFLIFELSTDWIGPTDTVEGHLLYPKLTDFSVNPI